MEPIIAGLAALATFLIWWGLAHEFIDRRTHYVPRTEPLREPFADT